MEKYAKVSPWRAYHLEQDMTNPDQLVISTFESVSTLKKNGEPSMIVGGEEVGYGEKTTAYFNAKFNYITGFRQVNTTHIIVVDKNNHCIRCIRRDTTSTYTLAGNCTKYGFNDGLGKKARFSRPYNIIDGYYKNEYYLTDTRNDAVRLITTDPELQTASVTTLATNSTTIKQPSGIALDIPQQYVYVVVEVGLIRIGIHDQQIEVVSPPSTGAIDGYLPQPTFGSCPESGCEIIAVTQETFLIINSKIEQLHLLNTKNKTLSAIACYDKKENTSGPCATGPLYCITFSASRDKLYLAQTSFIQVIEVEGNNSKLI